MVLYPDAASKIVEDRRIAKMFLFDIIANLSFLTILELEIFDLYKLLKTNIIDCDH